MSDNAVATVSDNVANTASTSDKDVSQKMSRDAGKMSILIIISRLTGFLRTWGQAFALGVSGIASCYSIANNLPNQLYELVVGGMLVTAFLPVYVSEKARHGKDGASRYASNLVSIVSLLMLIVSVVSIVFAAQVVWTQSFSATSNFDSDLAAWFYKFFAIEILLYTLSSVLSGILNAEREYIWSSAAPIFNNFVIFASFVAYALLHTTNPQLAMIIIAIGNPLGVLVQVLVQVPQLKRLGIRLVPRIDIHDPLLRETLSIGLPTFAVMAVSFVTASFQQSAALSVTESGASVSYYARLWYTLPYAVLAVPITTTSFTELSALYAKNDMKAYRSMCSRGMGQQLFLMIPMAVLLIVFSAPLVSLFGFIGSGLQMTSVYLIGLAIALPFYAITMYYQKVCSSLRMMGAFAIANIVAGVVQCLMCQFLTPVFGLPVVALSTAAFMLLVCIVSTVLVKRRIGSMGLRSVAVSCIHGIIIAVIAGIVGAFVLFLLSCVGIKSGAGIMQAIIQCVVAGLIGLCAGFFAGTCFGFDELKPVKRLVLRLFNR